MCSGSGQRYGADMEDSGLGFSSLLTVGAFLNLCIYTCMRVRVFVCLCVWTIREHTCGVFSAAVGAVSEAGDRCNRLYTRSGRSHVVGTVPFQK